MAYNFKNLADVELLSAMPENANIVVEVDGKTKRAPQIQIPEPVDEIALIVGSETLEEVPEGATVLAEVNGEIKRVPSDGLGGGIKTAIIKSSNYDQALTGVQTLISTDPEPVITYSCINMTFEEAYETLSNGKPMTAHLMIAGENAMNMSGVVFFMGTTINNVPCVVIEPANSSVLFWTADGISKTEPEPAVQPK